ncbi:MAG: porin family protein [Elusimicrobiota bacterium]|nr:porin family protein [Elusimicrobiota bacterium]
MKKLGIAVLAIMFLSVAAAFAAPEISLRAGVDIAGNLGLDSKTTISGFPYPFDSLNGESKTDGNETASAGFNIGAEILFPIAGIVKVGGGFAYLPDREIGKEKIEGLDKKMTLNALPIYATVQVSPFPISSLYMKGNIGVSIMGIKNGLEESLHQLNDSWDVTETFVGIYASIGAGYEFPFGLFAELAYDIHSASSKNSLSVGSIQIENDTTYTYTKLGLTVGYKFKL